MEVYLFGVWIHPNYQISIFLLLFPLGYYLFSKNYFYTLARKIFALALLIGVVFIFMLMKSRTDFLAVSAVLFVLFLDFLLRFFTKKKVILYTCLLFLLFIALYAILDSIGRIPRVLDVAGAIADGGSSRDLLWSAAIRMSLDNNNLMGIGNGLFADRLLAYGANGDVLGYIPHNTYLSTLLEVGLVGLIVFLVYVFYQMLKMKKNGFTISLLLCALIPFLFKDGLSNFWFWVPFILIHYYTKLKESGDGHKPMVMHINCVDDGSTGKIINEIRKNSDSRGFTTVLLAATTRQQSHEFSVLRTSLPKEQGLYKRINYVYGLRYGLAPLSTARIINYIIRYKPQVIHLHSINSNMVNIYHLMHFLRKSKIKTVFTNHAEFFYTGSCSNAYDCSRWQIGCGDCPRLLFAAESKFLDRTNKAWSLMKKAFANNEWIRGVYVSPWTLDRGGKSPLINSLNSELILNGIDTNTFSPRFLHNDKASSSSGDKTVLHVTASFCNDPDNIKGGSYVIKLAELLPTYTFLVVGPVEGAFAVPDNVFLLGQIQNQDVLAGYYSYANVLLLTSRSETFSMPCAESLCCGTPVVGFFAGGPETIALSEYSEFCPYGDIESLKKLVEKWANFKDKSTDQVIAEKARKEYNSELMAKKYTDLYIKMVDEGAA